MSIIINGDGSSIWADPEERLKEIEKVLEPRLEQLKLRMEQNDKSMYPQKLNFTPTVTNLADPELRKADLISYSYAVEVDVDTLRAYKNAWFDFIIFIRKYVPDYIANKQLFCAFMCISVSSFNQLRNSSNGEIVAIIESLLDSFEDTNMTGAMGGAVNTTATFNRMRAKDSGYSMQLKAEEQAQNSNQFFIMDNENIHRKLDSLFGGKLLDKKDKK